MGIGIEENMIDTIFNPFVTTKGPLGGGKQSGKGLGLSVAYGIIKSHNGDIKIESEAGSGTTVCVYLPVKEAMTKKPRKASEKRVKQSKLTKL
jgi:signal transduction histidine kinase